MSADVCPAVKLTVALFVIRTFCLSVYTASQSIWTLSKRPSSLVIVRVPEGLLSSLRVREEGEREKLPRGLSFSVIAIWKMP